MTMIEEIAASQELKQLVDTYANESDKNNQDYYVNVFTETAGCVFTLTASSVWI